VVQANTGVEQALTFQSDDEKQFREASGETTDVLQSHSHSSLRESISVSQFVTSFLTDADLKRVNDTKLASLVLINDGNPRAPGKRVLKVQGLYPISEAQYQQFRRTPLPQLPTAPPEFYDGSAQTAVSPTTPTEVEPEVLADLADLEIGMQAKWNKLMREELRGDD
jgi:hypothetical protein